jgi:hypothetical protein
MFQHLVPTRAECNLPEQTFVLFQRELQDHSGDICFLHTAVEGCTLIVRSGYPSGTRLRNRDTYPLFNTARFTRHIGVAYVTLRERYQRCAEPQAFRCCSKRLEFVVPQAIMVFEAD